MAFLKGMNGIQASDHLQKDASGIHTKIECSVELINWPRDQSPGRVEFPSILNLIRPCGPFFSTHSWNYTVHFTKQRKHDRKPIIPETDLEKELPSIVYRTSILMIHPICIIHK